MPRRNILPPLLRREAMAALVANTPLSTQQVNIAYLKWADYHAATPCRWGREKPIAVDCQCIGCLESLTFLFFDQVVNNLSAPLSAHTVGFPAH